MVVGMPRATVTVRALEPWMLTLSASARVMRMVACCLMRLNVLPPITSAPSPRNSGSFGFSLAMSAGLKVPVGPFPPLG